VIAARIVCVVAGSTTGASTRPATGSIPERSGKNPVNLFPALYPIKNNHTVITDPAPDPVLPDTNTVIILITAHLINIKFVKKVF
jgi:hypothetical protein